MKIEFDVAVEAELEVREADYHYDESEFCKQWFMLKCSGDLNCNLDDFTISSVTEYTSKNRQPKPMSDSLVPIINKEQLESVATDFLRRYYPEALKKPMAVEPQVLAEKMGLVVEMREITKDFSVFGQIYFHDCEAEFYEEDSDEMEQTHVDARTIFVDPKAYFLRNLGSVNNTLDSFIYMLARFYEKNEEGRKKDFIIEHAGKNNGEALLRYLNRFQNVNQYCENVYFITNQALISKLRESGKKFIEKAEDVVAYMNLALEFWTEKGANLKKLI